MVLSPCMTLLGCSQAHLSAHQGVLITPRPRVVAGRRSVRCAASHDQANHPHSQPDTPLGALAAAPLNVTPPRVQLVNAMCHIPILTLGALAAWCMSGGCSRWTSRHSTSFSGVSFASVSANTMRAAPPPIAAVGAAAAVAPPAHHTNLSLQDSVTYKFVRVRVLGCMGFGLHGFWVAWVWGACFVHDVECPGGA